MAMQLLSPKKFLVACAAVVAFGHSDARAASIFPIASPTRVTAGDPVEVSIWFDLFVGPGTNYLEFFHASLSYDTSILRPDRVTFTNELGSPDFRSWVIDVASGTVVPDQFGAGDANTSVNLRGNFPIMEGDLSLWEHSLIFWELIEPPRFRIATVSFDTLQPGMTAIDLRYLLNSHRPSDVSLVSTSVEVAPVPEPSTLLLMLAGAPWVAARMRQRACRRR